MKQYGVIILKLARKNYLRLLKYDVDSDLFTLNFLT